jgi:hypothetical protein
MEVGQESVVVGIISKLLTDLVARNDQVHARPSRHLRAVHLSPARRIAVLSSSCMCLFEQPEPYTSDSRCAVRAVAAPSCAHASDPLPLLPPSGHHCQKLPRGSVCPSAPDALSATLLQKLLAAARALRLGADGFGRAFASSAPPRANRAARSDGRLWLPLALLSVPPAF